MYLTLTGFHPPFVLLSSSHNVLSIKATNFHLKKICEVSCQNPTEIKFLKLNFSEIQINPVNQILRNKEKIKVKYTDQNGTLEDT